MAVSSGRYSSYQKLLSKSGLRVGKKRSSSSRSTYVPRDDDPF